MVDIENIDTIAREILNSCGGKKFLHIGSGNGQLVQALLASGIDAYGIDESFEAVSNANHLMPKRFIQGDAKQLPYIDKAFDTIIILYNIAYLHYKEIIKVIKELRRVTRFSVYLRVKTMHLQKKDQDKYILNRNEWENLFFNESFRKHPSYYLVNDYNALSRESGEAVILLELITDTANKRYPIEALKQERDLHMDMMRETGERSDAHIARYQWAATFVRPGDTVLDAACGLGYGSYILQCNTTAAKTIGIDSSDFAIDYANINFASCTRNLIFSVGVLPNELYRIPNNSIDLVVSFETLEHLPNPQNILNEFHRILTPAGRIIVSVPNDWSDETGKDPNPLHLHVYTLNKLRNQLKALFYLENITVQSATHYKEYLGSKNWLPAKREIYEIDINIDETSAPHSEWLLAVGMKSPFNTTGTVYRETQYQTFPFPEWNVTSFARDYKNPWLIRAMIDIGWRQKNKYILNFFIKKVIKINKNDNSADMGAALCIKGYQLLNEPQSTSIDILNKYADQVDKYTNNKSKAPHIIRWIISLHFVIAKLWLQAGMHDKARFAFMKCIKTDPLQFSPLLANRVVEAHLFLGKLLLNAGNEESARDAWIAGIIAAQRAVTADWKLSLGDLNSPAEFALPELSSILDHASNCAYAVTNLNYFQDKRWWWLQLQRSPHAQLALKKNQYISLNTHVLSLNTFVSSLQDIIEKQKNQLSEEAHHVRIKEKELDELTRSLKLKHLELINLIKVVNLKDKSIIEQATKLQECNTIMKTHLMQLCSIMLYQPFGARKIIYIIYLTVLLITPCTLRNKLQLVVGWMHKRYSQYLSSKKVIKSISQLKGYYIKKPLTKNGAPKVAHIIANFMMGGSSRLVVDLIEFLGHEYEQFVLTSYIPNPPAYIGIEIEEQSNRYDTTPFINYLKRKKPDFIHVHYWGDTDTLWYMQAIEAANVLNIPVIENVNTPTTPYISHAVKRYVYVSNYVRHIFGQSDTTHLTIYPGSNFSHFICADDKGIAADCVGMVYRLERDKLSEVSINPFILIAKKRPQTKILIVGGGTLLPFFQKAARIAGVESQFEFTGYVDYDTLPDYYRRMSLFIAPVWKESFGQVSAFAMNMQIPVIGYDVGAISEIVNSTKLLAPSGDAEKLAEIAVSLLDNDEWRIKIGGEHQRRAKENFSIEAMIKAYNLLYAEMEKNSINL